MILNRCPERERAFRSGLRRWEAGRSAICWAAIWQTAQLLFCPALCCMYIGKNLSKLVQNILGGALVTFCCVVLYHLGLGHHISSMIIGSVIPMIPGVAFTNGIRDITDGDYIAGSVRMMDAGLVVLSIALGMGFVLTMYYRLTGGNLL